MCDFCNAQLPDWKNVLTPSAATQTPAVMNVSGAGFIVTPLVPPPRVRMVKWFAALLA